MLTLLILNPDYFSAEILIKDSLGITLKAGDTTTEMNL
jgi:hypothetical protein